MWKDFLFSFIRRKVVLSLIFGCSLTYCIVSFLLISPKTFDTWKLPHKLDHSSFVWISSEGEWNNTLRKNCRNTVQGKELVADDRGYICQRNDLLANNCCGITEKRYLCESCNTDGCCMVYEHCVSCCLDPQKKKLLQKVLGKASETFRILFAAINDHFELCLAKCRTSSQSVQHENTYLKPNKHCYTTADKLP
ncbi:SREBP regulating gene protein [Daktulosphaira vitifoliae]|uniref:SREBP regulating gene protein n=1 Tax=Daktulosphaira vitifoliae TaxID=58002 RepID=UPI0021A987E3|nr:SREBP regulating gene protein [Daktulosphaira vitifoliae]